MSLVSGKGKGNKGRTAVTVPRHLLLAMGTTTRIYNADETQNYFYQQSILIDGDSTARRIYSTLYGILNAIDNPDGIIVTILVLYQFLALIGYENKGFVPIMRKVITFAE